MLNVCTQGTTANMDRNLIIIIRKHIHCWHDERNTYV